MILSIRFFLLPVTCLFVSLAGLARSEDIQFPPESNVFNVKAAPYNAAGDGTTDDTAAIQKAINDGKAHFHTIYFPNGVYRVTKHLTEGNNKEAAKHLIYQGESQAKTIIRLDNNLPDFGDPKNPVSVLCTCEENVYTGMAFTHSIYNLTIDVGSGNPGATALQYIGNNQTIIENVTLMSSDPSHAGKAGLDLRGGWPGPCLVKNLTVDGFDYAIWSPNHYDYCVSFEGLSIKNQQVMGVLDNHMVLNFRNFTSDNAVPVISMGDDSVTIFDGNFTGGSSTNTAITCGNANWILRNVNVSGYGRTMEVNGQENLKGTSIKEATASDPVTLFPSSPKSTLNLPVEETPDPGWADPASNWIVAAPGGSDEVQAAIDKAAAANKKTVCLPWQDGPTMYKFTKTIHIHGSVTRVLLMFQNIYIGDPLVNSGSPLFSIDSPDDSTVVIDRIGWMSNTNQGSNFIFAYHNSNCTLVLKDIAAGGQMYTCAPGKTGKVFIEDVCSEGFHFSKGQKVFCHYINSEGNPPVSMITNDGATLWIYGLKHEIVNNVITTTGGGTTEMIAGLLYPSQGDKTDLVPFIITDSTFSGTWSESVGDRYNNFAQVTRKGETKTLPVSALPNRQHMPLFVERPDSGGDEAVPQLK